MPSKTRRLHTRKTFAYGYFIVSLGMLPWILLLANTLPTRHLTPNWDVAWVGFDIFLALSLFITAMLILKKSNWVIMSATITATLLAVDAWFDVLTSRQGSPAIRALFFAGVVEIPLALLTYFIAYNEAKKII